MKKNNETKKQHYVPKMYLKNFTFDGVNCYTKNRKGEIYSQNISGICKTKYLYEFRDKDNKIISKNFVENILKIKENEFSSFLGELFKFLEQHDKTTEIRFPKNIERETIISFVMFMILRNPLIINNTREILSGMNINVTDIEAKNMAKMGNKIWLKKISKRMSDNYNIIIHKNIVAEKFITSDIPFSCLLLGEHYICYMPLSSEYFIVLTPKKLYKRNLDVFVINNTLNIDFFNNLQADKKDVKLLISKEQSILNLYDI